MTGAARGLHRYSIVILVALLPLVLSAQPIGAAGGRTVRGTVVNRSFAPARPVSGALVVVQVRAAGRIVATVQGRSDAHGRFALVVPPLPRGGAYDLITRYRGITYGVTLDAAAASRPVALPVYDTTSSDAGLAVMRVMVGLRRTGHRLAVIEEWSYVNAGAAGSLRTVVAAARIPLPPDATHVVVRGAGPLPATATVRDGSVVVNTIVRPATGLNASSFHQVIVTFDVPERAGHPTLLIPTRYFIGSLYVFTLGSRLYAPGFTQTTLPLGTQRVPALVAHAIAAGSSPAVGVDGPPAGVPVTTPAGAPVITAHVPPPPFPTTAVTILIGIGFLALLAFGLSTSLPAFAGARRGLDLQRERARLVGAIAELDLLHARGDVADEEYRRRRGQQKGRLLDVARQLGE